MQLSQLLNIHGHLDWRDQPQSAVAEGLYFDSRKVEQASIYVAIRGNSADGHDYIQSAIDQGAIALVVEDISKVPDSYKGAVVEVLDSRLSLQNLSQKFFGNPGDSMISVAVTGTNGKTSSSYILEYLLAQLKMKCGVIGTIDHHVGDKVWKTSLTSPDPVTLQSRLKDFVNEGANSFVIEASSHALDQKRLKQSFDVALFTNLSHDHLDYHKSMDAYFEAKALLFSESMVKEDSQCFAVINGDDPYGQQLVNKVQGRQVFRFGQQEDNDIVFIVNSESLDGCHVSVEFPNGQNIEFQNPMLGLHNVYNSVGCLAVIYSLGLNVSEAAQSLKDFYGVPGRMQMLKSPKGVYGFVDYAHTPDALQKSLDSLNLLMDETMKLIVVFGCGGDRDKEKRSEMGKIALHNSTIMVVTSDNPRSEDPDQIVAEIMKGAEEENHPDFDEKVKSITDRKEAIKQATEMADSGDVILVAGKGHETYQIIGDKTLDFDDSQVLQWFLRKAEQE